MAQLKTGPDQATRTQISNIEKKTGRSLAELAAAIGATGKTKHGEIRNWLIATFGLGAGDANTLAHIVGGTDGASAAAGKDMEAILAEIYSGKKAHQRPIHDALMAVISGYGEFEIAPKKGYLSLRRKKQFAMLGPKTNDRFELGVNLRDDVGSAKVVAQKPGGMCNYAISLTSPSELDEEVKQVLQRAFVAAG